MLSHLVSRESETITDIWYKTHKPEKTMDAANTLENLRYSCNLALCLRMVLGERVAQCGEDPPVEESIQQCNRHNEQQAQHGRHLSHLAHIAHNIQDGGEHEIDEAQQDNLVSSGAQGGPHHSVPQTHNQHQQP